MTTTDDYRDDYRDMDGDSGDIWITTVGGLRFALKRPRTTVTVNSPSLFGLVIPVTKKATLDAIANIPDHAPLDSEAIWFANGTIAI